MQKIVIGGEDLTKGNIHKESAQDMYTFQLLKEGAAFRLPPLITFSGRLLTFPLTAFEEYSPSINLPV